MAALVEANGHRGHLPLSPYRRLIGLVLWVANSDPYAKRSPVTPLADPKRWPSADFWKGVPFGRDARQREVMLPLVWSNFLLGSIPGMGKTNAARLPAAAAALD